MSMFKDEHYKVLAKALKSSIPKFNPRNTKPKLFFAGSEAQFAAIVVSLSQTLKQDNPEFDDERFCNMIIKPTDEERAT